MNLGYDFIILSAIIIISLLPLYLYRKVIFKKYYKNKDFTGFMKDLQIYFQTHHPKIPIKITHDNKNDHENFDLKKDLIIEDALNQFIDYEYEKKTQSPVKKELLWSSYEKDSIPQKNAAPKDLQRRKELILTRDKNACSRCGKIVKKDNSMLITIKDIKAGGTYHFENLTILCQDCNKVVNSDGSKKVLKDLLVYTQLFKKFIK